MTVVEEEADRQSPTTGRRSAIAVGMCLLAAATLQVLVGMTSSRVAGSQAGSALLVAAVGLVAALLTLALVALSPRLHVRQRSGPLLVTILVTGPVGLAVLGFVWVAGDALTALILEGVAFLIGVSLLLSKTAHLPRRQRTWIIASPVLLIAATASLLAVPSAPTLHFRLDYESRLNSLLAPALSVSGADNSFYFHCATGASLPALPLLGKPSQVCATVSYGAGHQAKLVAVELQTASGWGYLYSRAPRLPAEDTCLRHLDGSWWEEAPTSAGDAGSCPFGLHFVGDP